MSTLHTPRKISAGAHGYFHSPFQQALMYDAGQAELIMYDIEN